MASVKLYWSTKSTGTVSTDSYQIYRSDDDGANFRNVGSTRDLSFTDTDVVKGKAYLYAVSVRGTNGTETPQSKWKTYKLSPLGKPDVVPNVTNFTSSQNRDRVELKWDPVDIDDFSHYEMRQGPNWAGGKFLAKLTNEFAQPMISYATTVVYHVKAVDLEGNMSETAASTSILLYEEADNKAEATHDISGGGFAASTSVNMATSAAGLFLDAKPDIFDMDDAAFEIFLRQGPEYEIWGDRYIQGSLITPGIDIGVLDWFRLALDDLYSKVGGSLPISDAKTPIGGYEFDGAGDWIPQPQDETFSRLCNIYGDETAIDAEVYIKTSASNVASEASVTYGDWKPYQPGHHYCRWFKKKIVLRNYFGYGTTSMTRWRVFRSRRNKKDEGRFTVSAPGPHTINFGVAFSGIPEVVFSYLDSTNHNTAISVNVSLISSTQAQFKVYDSDGAEVTDGDVSWIAAGV